MGRLLGVVSASPLVDRGELVERRLQFHEPDTRTGFVHPERERREHTDRVDHVAFSAWPLD